MCHSYSASITESKPFRLHLYNQPRQPPRQP